MLTENKDCGAGRKDYQAANRESSLSRDLLDTHAVASNQACLCKYH